MLNEFSMHQNFDDYHIPQVVISLYFYHITLVFNVVIIPKITYSFRLVIILNTSTCYPLSLVKYGFIGFFNKKRLLSMKSYFFHILRVKKVSKGKSVSPCGQTQSCQVCRIFKEGFRIYSFQKNVHYPTNIKMSFKQF